MNSSKSSVNLSKSTSCLNEIKLRNCVYFSNALDISHCFTNSLKSYKFLLFIIFSGDKNDMHTNFCPEIDLSSSNKSIYFGFSLPSGFILCSIFSFLSVIIVYIFIIL